MSSRKSVGRLARFLSKLRLRARWRWLRRKLRRARKLAGWSISVARLASNVIDVAKLALEIKNYII